MKKISKVIYAALLATSMFACSTKETANSKTVTTTYEPESFEADMSGYEWIEGDIAEYKEMSLVEICNVVDNKGSGLFYFGYDTCQWCKRALPELNKVLQEYDFTTYYINVHSTKFTPTNEEIEMVMEKIDDALEHDESGEAIFYVPLVVGIKDGKVVGHQVSLVDDYVAKDINDPNDQMNDAQKKELQDIYRAIIEKIVD